MLQEEFGLSIDVPGHIITVTLDDPVVAAIAISAIAKGRHLLPPADRGLELRVRVQIAACVHVLQAQMLPALDPLASAARLGLVSVVLLHTPQRVVVMVIAEASDDLLARAGAVGQLGTVQEEAVAVVLQADGRRARQGQALDRLENVFFAEVGCEGGATEEEKDRERILESSSHFRHYIYNICFFKC